MNRKRIVFLAIAGMAMEVRSAPGDLHGVGIVRQRDSVWIDLDFREGRPARYRVVQLNDSTKKPCLQIEFQPASLDSAAGKSIPTWMKIRKGTDDALSVFIDLDGNVPWKSEWHDRVLQVSFLDRIRSRSMWKNPWLMAGVSAAVAGGTVFWLLGGGSTQSPPIDNTIPPPNIVLPR